MRKKILTIVLFIGIMSNAFALLPFGIYTGIRGGLKTNSSNTTVNSGQGILKDKSSPFIGAMFGVKLLSFRFELEHILRINAMQVKMGTSESSIHSQQSMMNVYYTFLDLPFVDFYVNAGLGTNKINSFLISNYDKSVWSAGFGVDISLVLVSLEAGYRYFNMGEITAKNSAKTKIDSHDIYAALKFGF